MRGAGLTQQQIADTAGVHVNTVANDLASSNHKIVDSEPEPAEPVEPSTVVNSRGQERPAT